MLPFSLSDRFFPHMNDNYLSRILLDFFVLIGILLLPDMYNWPTPTKSNIVLLLGDDTVICVDFEWTV